MYDWLKFHISNHSIFNHLFSCQLQSILFMRDIVWFVDALSIQVYCDWSSRLSLESLKRSHRNLTINMYEAVSIHTKQRSGLLNVDSLSSLMLLLVWLDVFSRKIDVNGTKHARVPVYYVHTWTRDKLCIWLFAIDSTAQIQYRQSSISVVHNV